RGVSSAAAVREAVAIDQPVRGAAAEGETARRSVRQPVHAALAEAVDPTVRAPVRPAVRVSVPRAVHAAVRSTDAGGPKGREAVRLEPGDRRPGKPGVAFPAVRLLARSASFLATAESFQAFRLSPV